ncbi:MAG TPA: sialidase family protein, partial [Solirubrobacteraceae bacterium]|nr:sialidase family protein [Solirubrobacteraceae bacterium]
MNEHLSLPRIDHPISRRGLLSGGVGAAALAALSSCDSAVSLMSARTSASAGANVRVSHDRYGVHVEPSVAANPRHPRQLLAACQASPTADPEFIATYISFDGGASWQNGGLPPQPAAGPAGDDVTVAFDAHGRGYLCATRAGHGSAPTNPANPDANRAVYVWRTDDGGRSFSAPVTALEAEYCDHPWLATGRGQNPPGHDVYVVWGAGATHTALDLARSGDSGQTFARPRRILAEASVPSLDSAGPELAT